jgi:hypothetical protein
MNENERAWGENIRVLNALGIGILFRRCSFCFTGRVSGGHFHPRHSSLIAGRGFPDYATLAISSRHLLSAFWCTRVCSGAKMQIANRIKL